MADNVTWLRDMAQRAGKGTINRVDGRALGRVADEIERLREEVVAFGGLQAARWAMDYGLPDGHIHPTHFDILERAGARMDSFTRAEISPKRDKSNG